MEIEVPEFNNSAFGEAWRKGAEAAVNGDNRSECPYDPHNYGSQGVMFSRAFWKRWQEGFDVYDE